MKPATATRMLGVRVDNATAAKLEQLARDADRSLSAELRRAVRAHLEREAKETQ